MKNPQWLQWAQRLQAIAQNGLTYTKDPFDLERFTQIRQIAAEILTSSDDPNAVDSVIDLFKRNFGYATPKVDVRAAVFDNNRILLVKERVDNAWALPGGWADIGDAPSVAALREVREESGYEAKVEKLAAVCDHNLHDHPPYPFHSYKIFFICTLAGVPQTSASKPPPWTSSPKTQSRPSPTRELPQPKSSTCSTITATPSGPLPSTDQHRIAATFKPPRPPG